MPFDFDRIIDHQLYLASQQCIQPYVQRRVSSAPAAAAAATTRDTPSLAAGAAGHRRTAGGRKLSLGSLISPWSPSSGGERSSSSSSNKSRRPVYPYLGKPSAQGHSPVDLFFAAPVDIPARGRGGHDSDTTPVQDDSSSNLDQFVTAPVGDFTAAAAARKWPRPGSSDSEDWTFATASGGSGTGLDTTIEHSPASGLTPPAPPLAGKMATSTPPPPPAAAAAATTHSPDPTTTTSRQQGLARVSAITLLVEDLARTKRFYERVFGAPCAFEDATSAALRFNGGALTVNLCEPADAREEGLLGPGVRVGGRADADRRCFLLSVFVEDVEGVYHRLRQLVEEEEGNGVVLGGLAGPVTRPWGMRVVTFRDPAGHCWEVAQDAEGG
ncbi:hypothetical protein diail_5573 [Diaporthe ilicicola]|nr:hypothetical protein diail_5573 [Diaporthe ilicicola]